MRTLARMALALLALSPPASAQPVDGARPEVATGPGQRLEEIVKAQQEALERYGKELEGAKSRDEGSGPTDRYIAAVNKNTGEILDLVRAHPADSFAVEALGFVIKTARVGPGDHSEQAIALLARDHVRDPKMGEMCARIFYFFHSPAAESLIRSVLEWNPRREDRAASCYMLATYLRYQAKMVRRLREKPEQVADFEKSRGKDAVARLIREKDPAALDREAEALLERVVAEFADVPYDTRTLGDVVGGELFAIRNLSVGKVAPEIEGPDHEGRSFKLGDERGKVVVLTFSDDWCGPCKALYPQERALVGRLKGKPFVMLSVNTDEDAGPLRRSIASGEITWRCWADGGTSGPITTRWGIASFPSVFVLDPRGVIRFVGVRGEELDRAVDALMAEVAAARP